MRNLHNWTGGYLTDPVVNSIGLKGRGISTSLDSAANASERRHPRHSIFDALDKQLGLKLEHLTAPWPALIVDSVKEKPTPNAPGLENPSLAAAAAI